MYTVTKVNIIYVYKIRALHFMSDKISKVEDKMPP